MSGSSTSAPANGGSSSWPASSPAPSTRILLDEPSSGLDATETENFGEILKRVVDEMGVGLLLVEHDMALVQQTCEQVYVLDFGEMIFEGTAQEMLASEVVRTAYLGRKIQGDDPELSATCRSNDGRANQAQLVADGWRNNELADDDPGGCQVREPPELGVDLALTIRVDQGRREVRSRRVVGVRRREVHRSVGAVDIMLEGERAPAVEVPCDRDDRPAVRRHFGRRPRAVPLSQP